MTPKPSHTATVTIEDQAARPWAPCPTCWGQRRIWTRVQAPNGEGAIHVARFTRRALSPSEFLPLPPI